MVVRHCEETGKGRAIVEFGPDLASKRRRIELCRRWWRAPEGG
jgi:hypothetical protein